MPEFEVLQVEARTGNVIKALPVSAISYGETLNAAGSASVTMPLDAADPDTLEMGRSGIVVVRDDSPVWGGIVWTGSADLSTETLTLNASGWHSYYAACYLGVWTPPSPGDFGRPSDFQPRGYTGAKDQAILLSDWIEWANDLGGIGTDTSRLSPTGITRKRSWGFAEFKNTAEAITELAEEDNGFDFRYETYWRNASRTRVGNRILKASRVSGTFPALTHGVNAEVTQVAYDGSKLATTAWAFGADMGTGLKPSAKASNTLATPTLTQVVTYPDLKATADLTPKARALSAVGRKVIAIPTVNLYPGVFAPELFVPGAYGTVNARSGYVRLNSDFVVSERRVQVDANGTESASLSLASKEVFVYGDAS